MKKLTKGLCLALSIILGVRTGACFGGDNANSAHIAADLPAGMWSVTEFDREALVLCVRRAKERKAELESFELLVRTLPVGKTARPGKRATWKVLCGIATLFPGWPPAVDVVDSGEGGHSVIAVELQGGASYFKVGWIPHSRVRTVLRGGRAEEAQSSERDEPEWLRVSQVDYGSGKPDWYLSVFRFPALAHLQKELFLAGQTPYPGETGYEGIWVVDAKDIKNRSTTGSLLGKGRVPALMAVGDNLYCLAIEPTNWAAQRRDFAGRVVGWVSGDGSNWEPAELAVPEANVAKVDACAYGDAGFIACLCDLPNPRISVFHFGKGTGKVDEIDSFALGKEGKVSRALAVRMIGDELVVFWDETAGEKKKLFAKKVELPRGILPVKELKRERPRTWLWVVVAALLLSAVGIRLASKHRQPRGGE
jgi:hypothetical protein